MKSLNFTNRRTVVAILIVALAFVVAAWWIRSRQSHTAHNAAAETRKIIYFQCPMHPWVKSDKPGKCTVCGMELVPVYDGAQLTQGTTDIVMLPPGAPNVASIRTVEVQ